MMRIKSQLCKCCVGSRCKSRRHSWGCITWISSWKIKTNCHCWCFIFHCTMQM